MRKNSKVLKSFIETLKIAIPGFTEYSETHQHHMAALIWQEGSKRRRHNRLEGYMFISWTELRDKFGQNGFKKMNEALGIFEVTNNWSHENKEGKGYKLTLKIREIKDNYYALEDTIDDDVLYTTSNGDIRTMKTIPKAVAAKDAKGRHAKSWGDVTILNKTPVDREALNVLYNRLHEILKQEKFEGNEMIGYDIEDVKYRIDSLCMVKKMSGTDVAGLGFVMILYHESESGRLYADGFSLQTAPRIVRNTALNGLYDYDIENCHFTIFYQLSEKYGYKPEGIDFYLTNKAQARKEIADDIGITVDQAKKCLLMFLYGARASDREENSIPEEIGVDKAKLFYNHKIVADIHNDVKKGRKAIINGWDHKNSVYLLNALNKGISVKATAEEKLAHIIQGIEAKAIKEVIKLYPNDICLLMHDGFVATEELDLNKIESTIKEATGMSLSVSSKKLESFY